MTAEKISTLLSDVSIEGDIVEKDRIVIDAKVNGDIKSESVETHSNSNIKGNIKCTCSTIGMGWILFLAVTAISKIPMPINNGRSFRHGKINKSNG